ncbi:MAG: nucleotidyltransferase domain-containing protein [Verrucomicrobia bacterium]|nr:nucleotidyltransferase domain-containing protein [Verrucomicrobiota bacterium]
MNSANIFEKVAACLDGTPLHKCIVFGSHARGDAGQGSDVDLIIVLDQSYPFQSTEEYHQQLMSLRKKLRPIAVEYGLDLIVFTIPDWQQFLSDKSSFAREVQSHGILVA